MSTTTTSNHPSALHTSLLRPPILHILRATGFHSSRPSVVDTLVDLTARYIQLLARETALSTSTSPHYPSPTIEDVRIAMQACGVFRPQLSLIEEEWIGEEDMRGVEAFLDWVRGKENGEIMRIAGMERKAEGPEVAGGDGLELEREDYLAALKKKHSKTGEESKFQGTLLGKPADAKLIKIEGGPAESIQDWAEKFQQQTAVVEVVASPTASSVSALSEAISMDDEDDGGDAMVEG